MVQWIGLQVFTAEGPGSIPGKKTHLIWQKIAQPFQDLWKASKYCQKNQLNKSMLLFFYFSFSFFSPNNLLFVWSNHRVTGWYRLYGEHCQDWKLFELDVFWGGIAKTCCPKSSLPPVPGRLWGKVHSRLPSRSSEFCGSFCWTFFQWLAI